MRDWWGMAGCGKIPYTTTRLAELGTYTLPLATVGETNLVIGGIWSRAEFMSLFHNSLVRSDASYACSVPGVPAW